jgi:uncharacterized protein YunC (DUF1805 family)
MNNRNDYSIQTSKLIKLNDIEMPEIQLLILKNEITIAMSCALKYQLLTDQNIMNMQNIGVKTKLDLIRNNQLKINL